MRIDGAKLSTERERKILSHRELARAAGLSSTRVIKLEIITRSSGHTRRAFAS